MNHDHPLIAALAALFTALKKSALYIGGWIVSLGLAGFNEIVAAVSGVLVLVLTSIRIWKEVRGKEKQE